MKVAIVSPFHHEPLEQLGHCMRSVAEQGVHDAHSVEHVIVADGDDPRKVGEAMKLARIPTQKFPRVISLPVAHADWGNCARAVGALDAVSRGFDAVAFLDGDNWIEPAHVQTMIALHVVTGAKVCTASRTICRLNGSPMFFDGESDGARHVDTNCLFITRGAFHVLPFWAFVPASHAAVGDRVFWQVIKLARDMTHAHSGARTVNYRTRYAAHYRAIDEAPPPEAKENAPTPAGIMFDSVVLLVPSLLSVVA
jgi:glycosyltransferase involved in cell wall biosynthesis